MWYATTPRQVFVQWYNIEWFTLKVPFSFQGPVHIFNAKSEWSATKTVALEKRNGGYGFSVIGSAPVIVQSVEKEGAAKVIYTLTYCPAIYKYSAKMIL